jgi:hypothetical protein
MLENAELLEAKCDESALLSSKENWQNVQQISALWVQTA